MIETPPPKLQPSRPPGELSHLWSMFPLVTNCTYFLVVTLPLLTMPSPCLLRLHTREKHT